MPEPESKLSKSFVDELVEKLRSNSSDQIQSVFDAIVSPETGEFYEGIASAVRGTLQDVLQDGTLADVPPYPLGEVMDEQAAKILLRLESAHPSLMAEMSSGNMNVLGPVVMALGFDRLANGHEAIAEVRLGIESRQVLEFMGAAEKGLRIENANLEGSDRILADLNAGLQNDLREVIAKVRKRLR